MFSIRRYSIVLVLAALALSGCSRHLPTSEQTVSGVRIDIGIVPASQAAVESMGSSSARMTREASQNAGLSHLTVALFDANTGSRITNARVEAGVGANMLDAEPTQWLQSMPINGMMSYGGLFQMTGGGKWHIHLRVYLAGSARPIDAVFGYEPSDLGR